MARTSDINAEDQDERTSLALLQSDLRYLRSDVAEIKQEFRDFKTYYATKEDLLRLQAEVTKDIAAANRRLNAIFGFGSAILLAVTTAVAIALIKLVGPSL